MSQGARGPHAPAADVVNPEVRFEHEDVDPGKVARYAVALGLVSVVTSAMSIWLLLALRRHEEGGDPRRPALYFGEEQRQPEGVRLQNAPFQDLAVLREREAQFLHGYGWVDRSAGVVHIPIEQAMHLYIERQARAAAAPSPAAAEGVPTDSAPVPSPRALAATPLPPPPPSPAASGTPAPPPAHGPGPGGGRQ